MKKFTLLFVAALCATMSFAKKPVDVKEYLKAQIAANQSITPFTNVQAKATPVTAQPAGELRYYKRDAQGVAMLTDDDDVEFDTEGTVGSIQEVVFNGNTIWINDVLSSGINGWIQGTRSGNTLTVSTGQCIMNLTQSGSTYDLYVAVGNYNSSSKTYTISATSGLTGVKSFTYTLSNDDNTIKLDGTSQSKALCLAVSISIMRQWVGIAAWGTELSKVDMPDGVTPPAGITPEAGTLTATDHEGSEVTGDVQTVIDGNDMYIKGLCPYAPDGWMKGTIYGNTVEFPTQFAGALYSHVYLVYFGGVSNDGSEFLPAIFDYDASTKVLTATNVLGITINDTGNPQIVEYYSPFVVNAVSAGINRNIATDSNVKSISYTDALGRSVSTPVKGMYIQTTTLSDGTKKVVKFIK